MYAYVIDSTYVNVSYWYDTLYNSLLGTYIVSIKFSSALRSVCSYRMSVT